MLMLLFSKAVILFSVIMYFILFKQCDDYSSKLSLSFTLSIYLICAVFYSVVNSVNQTREQHIKAMEKELLQKRLSKRKNKITIWKIQKHLKRQLSKYSFLITK